VNLLWLYVASWLGMHRRSVAVFQVFMVIWLLLNLGLYWWLLRRAKQQQPALTFGQGMKTGALAALASAAVAALAQVGYYKVIDPGWPEFMVNHTREHFISEGKSAEEVAKAVEQAKQTFTLGNYAASSAVTALLTGVVLSALLLLILRRKHPPAAA
jgi:hypothetical protein